MPTLPREAKGEGIFPSPFFIPISRSAQKCLTSKNAKIGFRQGGRRGKPQAYSLRYAEDFPRSTTQYKDNYCVRS